MANATLDELTAVNEILANAGFSPVNSLGSSAASVSSRAHQELLRQSKEVQAQGWYFNLRSNYELTPNAANEIVMPPEIFRVNDQGSDFIVIQGKLFSTRNNSFTFTSAVTVDAVLLFDYGELPFEAQDYILKRAKTRFQTVRVGDPAIQRLNGVDEINARASLMQVDAENAARNILLSPSLRGQLRGPLFQTGSERYG